VLRVLDVRVYRAAFVPALVALFLAAFSLTDRPAPATSPLAADAFDATVAFGDGARPERNSLNELARSFPARLPGGPGDDALAERVASTLAQPDAGTSRPAFQVTRTSVPSGAGTVETVVGVRPGTSSRRIVVLANRDARSSPAHPARAELSATATLLELARLFRQRDLRKTLVLVSTSGATTGFAGARAWAEQAAGDPIDAVLVLGDVATAGGRKPWVVPWSTGSSPAPLGLQRTLESALRTEVAPNPGGARAFGQWMRRAVPLTISGQGVAVAAGLPAVLVGASGERGPAPDAPVSRARLRSFGRATLRAVTAIDGVGSVDDDRAGRRPPFAGTQGIVTLRNVLPDWAVRMLVGTLLAPALLAAVDGWFRARRRRLSVERWAGRIVLGALPLVLAWLWLRLLGATGALSVPGAPVAPSAFPLGAPGAIAAVSALAVALAGRFGVRPLLLRRLPVTGSPAAGGLAAATGLLVTLVAALVWVANPYAAALLLPAAHLWLLAAAPGSRLRGAAGALAAVLGLVLPGLAVVYYARALGLGPLDLGRLGVLVTADGHVSPWTALAVAIWLACLGALLTILRTSHRVTAAAEPEKPRTRGPAGYAGPGSLGGTESALRR
jgi:hypothetical protein